MLGLVGQDVVHVSLGQWSLLGHERTCVRRCRRLLEVFPDLPFKYSSLKYEVRKLIYKKINPKLFLVVPQRSDKGYKGDATLIMHSSYVSIAKNFKTLLYLKSLIQSLVFLSARISLFLISKLFFRYWRNIKYF